MPLAPPDPSSLPSRKKIKFILQTVHFWVIYVIGSVNLQEVWYTDPLRLGKLTTKLIYPTIRNKN